MLRHIRGVVGVGLGLAQRDGIRTDEPALVVHVRRKRDPGAVRPPERLPARWPGPAGGPSWRLDVVEAEAPASTGIRGRPGDPRFAAPVRPIRPGYSFGLLGRAGTLGLVVAPRTGPPRPLLLSSSHVLNQRPDGVVYDLFQPAGVDRRDGAPPVARSYRYTRLHPRAPNHSEGGLAEPLHGTPLACQHPLGSVRGVRRRLVPGERLTKVSRTTGRGTGTVAAVEWAGRIRFGHRRYGFARQVLVTGDEGPVSLDGDSGAVWLTEEGEAAALAFAGCRSGCDSVATPVARLLEVLDVRLPTDEESESWTAASPPA